MGKLFNSKEFLGTDSGFQRETFLNFYVGDTTPNRAFPEFPFYKNYPFQIYGELEDVNLIQMRRSIERDYEGEVLFDKISRFYSFNFESEEDFVKFTLKYADEFK